jgi:hypothetical protein
MPHSLAEAWAIEVRERGATPASPGYDESQNLFYAGAAAMLAMVAQAGASNPPSTSGYMAVLDLLQTIKAELQEYLEDV